MLLSSNYNTSRLLFIPLTEKLLGGSYKRPTYKLPGRLSYYPSLSIAMKLLKALSCALGNMAYTAKDIYVFY